MLFCRCGIENLAGYPGDCDGEDIVCLDAYQTAVDDNVFSTALNTPQATGKQLVTPAVPAGSYLFQVSYVIEGDEFENFHVNVTLDGAAPGAFIFIETHDELFVEDDDGQAVPYERSICLTLSEAIHTFEIYLWTVFNNTQTIRETTMELWRTT